MMNQRTTSNRRWLEYGWLMTGLLATCWLVLQAAPASFSAAKVVGENTPGSGATMRTRNIEDVRVGDRIAADAGDARDTAVDLYGVPASWDSEPVDPKTWKKITFVYLADDATVDIALLRPAAWIEDTGAWVGNTVHLVLPEQAVDGEAEVVSIDDCPPIASGFGSVVTGTFTRVRLGILNLFVAGLEKPIGVTANHSIYSVDRGEFVHASELSEGETLQLLLGNAQVTHIEPLEGEQRVYNLEVHGTHVFRVSRVGVLVHNATAKAEAELLDPKKIRFSQDSIKKAFKDPKFGSIDDLIAGLKSGKIKPEDVDPIRLVKRGDHLISIDNRRLQAFREAGVKIRTRMATAEEILEAEKQGKFSAGEFGCDTIKIRGEQ